MGFHVLIVEDEPDGQQVISGLLSYVNVTADTVGTAEEGLVYLNEYDYAGVVIDLALPGMDGFSLLEAIRTSPHLAALPCVAVTAFHSSTVKKQVYDSGF